MAEFRTVEAFRFSGPNAISGRVLVERRSLCSKIDVRPHRYGSLRGDIRACALLLGFVANALPVAAQIPRLSDSSDRVNVTAVAERSTVLPGADVPVAVVFDHDRNWHTHTNAPNVPPELGDASLYIKTEVASGSSVQVHAAFIQWPEPHTVNVAFGGEPVPYAVFSGKAVAYVPVTVSPEAQPGPAAITLKVTCQACDDAQCLAPVFDQPVEVNFTIPEAGAAGTTAADAGGSGLFSALDPGVWQKIHAGQSPATTVTFDLFGRSFGLQAGSWFGFSLLLLVAAFGVLLLNLTPCVLPVIPIKVIGLAQTAGDPQRGRALGLSFR